MFKYRLQTVKRNLSLAFPNKTSKELDLIEKKFYNHFADKSSKNKWESDFKLRQIDIDKLPQYLIENKDKYKEWFSI